MNNNSFDPNAFGNEPQSEQNTSSTQQVSQVSHGAGNSTDNGNNSYPAGDPNSYYTDYRQQPLRQPAHGLAMGSLICGIIGILCCGLPLGIAAIICAYLAKKQGNTEGIATAGLVCGIIALVGAVISLIVSPILSAYLANLLNDLANDPEFTTFIWR